MIIISNYFSSIIQDYIGNKVLQSNDDDKMSISRLHILGIGTCIKYT